MVRLVVGNLALWLFLLNFLALAGEVGLRVRYGLFKSPLYQREGRQTPFYRGTSYPYQVDTRLGWSLRPSNRAIHYGDEYEYFFHINAAGLRSEHELDPTVPRKRILALGDSFTFGVGVSEGREWAALLEKNLETVDVLNAGINGYSAVQSLTYFKSTGVSLLPDLVLFCPVENVLSWNAANTLIASNGQLWSRPYATLENNQLVVHPQTSKNKPNNPGFLKESFLLQYLRAVMQHRSDDDAEKILHNDQTEAELFQLLSLIIGEMRQAVEHSGATFLVVHIPTFHSVFPDHPSTSKTVGIRSDLLLADACKKAGAPYLSLLPAFRQHAQSKPNEPLYFLSDGHPRPVAQQIIADVIEKALHEKGLLK